MSPKVFERKGFVFFFYSREENRMHVHVKCQAGIAKFWLEPSIELCSQFNLKKADINTIRKLIEGNIDEIKEAWRKHRDR